MYDVSDDFKVAVRYSHQILTKAEVLRDGQVIQEIYPESGSVEVDARRAQRRTCEVSLHAGGQTVSYTPTYNTYTSLGTAYASYTALKAALVTYQDSTIVVGYTATTDDDGLVPSTGLDLLTPFGNELKLYRGLRYQKAGSYTYAALSATYSTYDTATLRTNISSNPSVEADTTGVAANNATLSRVAATWGIGSYVTQTVATTTSANVGPYYGKYNITAGVQYSASIYARHISGTARAHRVSLEWYTSADVYISTSLGIAVTLTTATQLLTVTGTAPATAAKVYVVAYSTTTGAVSDTAQWDGVLLEQASSVGSYFDGTYLDGAWTGAVNNSASTRVVWPMDRRNLITNPSFTNDTTGWGTNDGSTIARITTDGFIGSSCLQVTQAATTYSGFRSTVTFPVIASTSYTLSLYVKVPSGEPSVNLLLNVQEVNAAGSTVNEPVTPLTAYTSASGWTRISKTFTTTSTTTSVKFLLINGTATPLPTAGQKFLVDGVLLEQASSAGTYFDGSWADPLASPYVRPEYGWIGTAHASESYLKASDGSITTALENAGTYDSVQQTTAAITTVDEYAPLGVFPMTNVDINQDASGVELAITGMDRSLRISRNRWMEPYQIAAETNVADALTALLQDRWTDIPLKFSTTTATTTATTLGLDSENDPWTDAVAIAEAAGLDLFFNADGECVLRAIPDYSVAASVEKYNEDEEAMLLTTSRSLSADGVYNAVVVTAEGTSTDIPYRSTAIDEDPASPTYVYGPFGFSPTFVSTPLVNSQAAADAYAAAELNRMKGTDEAIQWTQIVDPTLDAGDVVAVVNVASKLARAIVLDRLTIPLAPDTPMNAQGRTIVYQTGDAVVTSSGEVVTVYAKDTSSSGAGSTSGSRFRTQSIR